MGAKSLIIGYIEEPFIADQHKNFLVKDHNRAKLFILPKIDQWPRITRGFFSVSGSEETYSNSLIYFGGTFKQIEDEWSQWLDKFESLLRTLIWMRVKLLLETEYRGEYIQLSREVIYFDLSAINIPTFCLRDTGVSRIIQFHSCKISQLWNRLRIIARAQTIFATKQLEMKLAR